MKGFWGDALNDIFTALRLLLYFVYAWWQIHGFPLRRGVFAVAAAVCGQSSRGTSPAFLRALGVLGLVVLWPPPLWLDVAWPFASVSPVPSVCWAKYTDDFRCCGWMLLGSRLHSPVPSVIVRGAMHLLLMFCTAAVDVIATCLMLCRSGLDGARLCALDSSATDLRGSLCALRRKCPVTFHLLVFPWGPSRMSAVLHACARQLLVRLLNVGGVVTQVLLACCSSALRLGLLSSLSTTNVSQGLCTLQ